MTFEWLDVVRDVLVIGYMFVLRIGVPIIITYLVGRWLQKVLHASDAAEAEQAALDESGVHCWEIKNCPAGDRASCVAAQHPELPCWLALQVSGGGLKRACYTCPLYVTGPSVPRVAPVVAGRLSHHA